MNSANSGCAAASWRFEESSGLKITQMTKDRERIIKIRVYYILYNCKAGSSKVNFLDRFFRNLAPSWFLPAQPVAKRAKCGVRKHRSSRIWSWYPLGSQMNAINKPTNTNSELGKQRKIWIQSQQLSSRFTRFLMFFYQGPRCIEGRNTSSGHIFWIKVLEDQSWPKIIQEIKCFWGKNDMLAFEEGWIGSVWV